VSGSLPVQATGSALTDDVSQRMQAPEFEGRWLKSGPR